MDEIAKYFETRFSEVEGWVQPAALTVLQAVNACCQSARIGGGACEIGVHHGRFFIALLACIESGQSVAIDVFEDQFLNIDRSGKGSEGQFVSNLKRFGRNPDSVQCIKADSLGINAAQLARIWADTNGFRLFSVDGGHTATHALNDILIAQELVRNGGIVIVDDIFHPEWPGVTEAVYRYYASINAKLAPLCVAGGKLFMTSFSYHEAYLAQISKSLQAGRPGSIQKRIVIGSFPAISFRLHHDDPVLLTD